MKIVAPTDFRECARRRLPRFLFEYIDGGSYAETTLGNNRDDLAGIELRQRVLRDVDTIDTAVSLFGHDYALPVGMGPVGIAGLNARRGETQAVRAAATCNVPFSLSTVSACPLDEVAAAASQPFWFQLYIVRDRGFMRELMAQAKELGCSALLFTVDLAVPGTRYRDYRSGLSGSPGLGGRLRRVGQVLRRPRWLWDVGINGRPITLGNLAPVLGGNTGIEDLMGWIGANFDSQRDLARSRFRARAMGRATRDQGHPRS